MTAPGSSRRKPDRLDALVQEFVDRVLLEFPCRARHRPQALKDALLAMVRRRMPPFPKRPGRPPSPRITLATEAFLAQRREIEAGARTIVSWAAIGQAANSRFREWNSYRRKRELARLRAAISARLRRRETRNSRKVRRANKPGGPFPSPPPAAQSTHEADDPE